MEVVSVNEPQWILEKADSGIFFWKRNADDKRRLCGVTSQIIKKRYNITIRVKFRFDVDVKEFHRASYEMEDQFWPEIPGKDFLISVSCAICISLTVVVLPWYVMLGRI